MIEILEGIYAPVMDFQSLRPVSFSCFFEKENFDSSKRKVLIV
jgi:hypothetical protein